MTVCALHFQLFHNVSLLADTKCVFLYRVLIVIMQLESICPDDDAASIRFGRAELLLAFVCGIQSLVASLSSDKTTKAL